jgi:N-acetylmuramoyl-L-alanine amidase
VELAFISNAEEERLLANDDWQSIAACAISRGIGKYLGVGG